MADPIQPPGADMADPKTLDISTICGRSFSLCVESSLCGWEIKQMLTEMDSAFEVPKMHLLHKNDEIPDSQPIGLSISDAQAMLTLLLSRPKHCSEFLAHPCSLRDASSEVVKDKDCVLHQITVDPMDLKYAPAFQNDTDVVLVAVKINGSALQYASTRLQDDIDVVVAAIESKRYCILFASVRLQNIPEVALLQEVHFPIKTTNPVKFECSRSYCLFQWMQCLRFHGGTIKVRTLVLCAALWMTCLILAVGALTASGMVSGVLLSASLIVIACHVGAFAALAPLHRRCDRHHVHSKLVQRAKWQAERV
jgi:hypothetical protein